MSGDAKVGNSELYIDGGSVTCSGDIFYTTNTESHITLKNKSVFFPAVKRGRNYNLVILYISCILWYTKTIHKQ